MVFKKIGALSGALLLALASLFALSFGSEAQAVGTTLYWCEFSSNGSFNTAANWNTNSDCSSGTQEVPASGDILVFDNSTLNSSINIANNMSGLDISSITFQGNGSSGYSLSGNDISLDAGITDIGSGNQRNSINLNVNLTANQTFDTSGNDLLTFGGSSSFSGSASLAFAGAGGGSVAKYQINNASSSFSGPVTIASHAAVQDLSGSLNGLGTGLITVNNGGSLYLLSSSTNATITNPLNLNGAGDGIDNFGALVSCLGPSTCTSSNSTLKLSGNVALSGNTQVINGAYTSGESSPPASSATFDFTGKLTYNGFSLSGFPASNTLLILPPVSGSATGSTKTPKAPDTGIGLSSNSSYWPIVGGSVVAISLISSSLMVIRRLNKNAQNRK